MSAGPLISVCILSGRRPALLERCLASLQSQLDPPPFEVLVGADGDGAVRAFVLDRFPDATVVSLEGQRLGAARNVLVERARGELLLFVDDDVTVEPGLLRRLADLAQSRPDVVVFGGPNETPPSSSWFQVVQGAVLASIVGSGPVRRRYGPHPAGRADERWFILCNLSVRRHAMLPFPDELVGGEENAVLSEMSRRGLRMHYEPALVVYHQRRDTLRGFADQMYKYGLGRGSVMRRDPRQLRPAYLVPSAFLVYLLLVPALATASLAWLLPLAVYAGAVVAGGLKIAYSLEKAAAAPVASVLFVVLHVCYGAGVLSGLVVRYHRRPRRATPASSSTHRTEPHSDRAATSP